MTIAEKMRMTIFDLFRQDCGEVIDLINYFVDKAQEPKEPKDTITGSSTGYDGFWDM